MSYASLLEDIIKIRDDVAHFRAVLESQIALNQPDHGAQINAHVRKLTDIIFHFERLLELATQPGLDLAHEAINLRKEFDIASARSQALGAELDATVAANEQAAIEAKAVLATLTRSYESKIAERDKTIQKLEKQLRLSEKNSTSWQLPILMLR